uniref:Multicopper oxidase n=1 Tax=Lotharella oceanica TaxID=641309 RepID=A0A7S2TWV3_9EUKA|mmetsp:Transcript_33310/g.61936  ORF Transcript_33310/g.61936 Transcript_33310/m.61936 type:complete len:508 (+) Transcript_33310:94-1617(+)
MDAAFVPLLLLSSVGYASGALAATNVRVVLEDLVIGDETYKRYAMKGDGPQWFEQDGTAGIKVRFGDDSFKVVYHNLLDVPTVIHQHGLTPSHNLDGVPYMSTPPIQPSRSSLVEFPLTYENTGTYFLHSHYGFQHELGVGAPVIVEAPMPLGYPLRSRIRRAKDVVMMLEDFGGYFADNETTNLDGFSPNEVYQELVDAWGDDSGEWDYEECMAPGDGMDVHFRYHLCNSKTLLDPVVVKHRPGDDLRIRVISGTTMSNYKLEFPVNVTLIAVDGQPVKPKRMDTFWIAVAQRADFLMTIPRTKNKKVFPIFARVASDKKQRSGLVITTGSKANVPEYSLTTDDAVGDMGDGVGTKQEMTLEAWKPLSPRRDVHWFHLNITGDNGFNAINRVSYQLPPTVPTYTPNPNPLVVKYGERVCIQLRNFNADAHPFHMHGKSFQVVEIDGQEFNGAMRDVVLTPKGDCKTVSFCFDATNPGVWPLHCHMAYHLYAGMLTTIEYEGVALSS